MSNNKNMYRSKVPIVLQGQIMNEYLIYDLKELIYLMLF